MGRDKAKKAYNILNALNSTLLYNQSGYYVEDGSWTRFNNLLEELATAYNDEVIKDYAVRVQTSHSGSGYVYAEEFKRQVYAATLYLHEQHMSDFTVPPQTSNRIGATPSTVVNQTQSAHQHTEVNVEFNVTLMQITELLIKAEAQFPDQTSKENKFIKKLKQILPVAKSSVEILNSVLITAHELGLTPADLLKVFGIHV